MKKKQCIKNGKQFNWTFKKLMKLVIFNEINVLTYNKDFFVACVIYNQWKQKKR